MQYHYSLHYNAKVLRAAAFSYLGLVVGPVFPLVLLGLLGYLGWQFHAGDRSWLMGAFSGALLVCVLMLAALVKANLDGVAKAAAEMAKSSASLGLSTTGIRLESALGVAELPWSAVSELHQRRDFLLLRLRRGSYTSLPLQSLDAQGIAYIKNSLRQAGVKVS
ncbi:MAG: YcxB family protein [Pseudomonas sp.]|uniref:YcxB family protein n=1 Tax=Pseudomonas sp. TaxID=306 RepID=UPI00339AFBD9